MPKLSAEAAAAKFENRLGKMTKNLQKMQLRLASESTVLKAQENQIQTILVQLQQTKDNEDFDLKSFQKRLKEIVKNNKQAMKEIKSQNKGEKLKEKKAKKEIREQKKAEKEKKKQNLENARLNELPKQENLKIIVDGFNIMGCDSQLRTAMRKAKGKAKGMLLEQLTEYYEKYGKTQGYAKLELWFDHGGKLNGNQNVTVIHSGNDIVDNRLVQLFQANQNQDEINCCIVITSDRELTLRLHALGVKVMKSGVFYRHLREQIVGKNENINEIEINDESQNENDNEDENESDNKENKNKNAKNYDSDHENSRDSGDNEDCDENDNDDDDVEMGEKK